MQPENSPVPNGPEQVPANVAPGGERIPVLPTPEGGLETREARTEQTAEASAAAADFAAAGAPPLPPPLPPAAQVTQPTSSSPAVAGDEDVIEKEWVDKAKQIIEQTKDDPYARTTRVNELQRDYLQKRYNKNLGASE